MIEKGDHISLTLSAERVLGADDAASEGGGSNGAPTRKSLRRSWNQLPRCQRNLIIIGISAVCVTLLLFLPGDQIESVAENRNKPLEVGGGGGGVGVFPFHANRADGIHFDAGEGVEAAAVVAARNSLGMESGADELAAAAVVARHEMHPLEFKKLSLHAPQPQSQPDHVVKLPEIHKSDYPAQDAIEANANNKINIQEVNINQNNNIEAPAAEHEDSKNNVAEYHDNSAAATSTDDRPALEAAVQDPLTMPGTNGITIEDFVKRLESTTDAQKQHFHGATNERQEAVVAAFKHSWAGYKKYAWGHDNLKPISQSSHDWFGLGLTIVDSLDTMYIMGLEDEFLEARNWVDEFLTFDINRDVNLFEVTIRVLGGLMSTYHLSGDKMFLKKSVELGNRLLPCFLSPSGIPYSDVNLASMSAHSPKWSPDSSTSEVTTIQLEFRDLSRAINIPMYERVAHLVNEKVHALDKNDGLVPIFINANTGTFRNYATISLGARGDSYYEYLLKQWIQTGCKENDFLILDYLRAIDGVLTKLKRRTPKEQHVYIGELINGKDFKPKMDHLTCYLPGTLLLGHKFGMPDSHLLLARDLLETCYQTYMKQPTQLAAEITYFAVNDNEEQELYVKPNDAHNLQRPEFIESLYYFYALTGNRTYQDMGWNIFQAFEKHTKVASGYTSIGNVKNVFNTRLRDMMESFWLGETLKYFYLLFSDNRKEIDVEKWIFNTEAHPLPIRSN